MENRRVCWNHFKADMYNDPTNTRSSQLLYSAVPCMALSHQTSSTRTKDAATQTSSIPSRQSHKTISSTQTPRRSNPSVLARKLIVLNRKLRGFTFRSRNRRRSKIFYHMDLPQHFNSEYFREPN